MNRTMTVHAFVDESRRGFRYFVAAAIAQPTHLHTLRRDLRKLLIPNQREIHFAKEKDVQRRKLADAIAQLPIEVAMYSRMCGRQDESARQTCLRAMTQDLLRRKAQRLVLDSRSQSDVIDRATLSHALRDAEESRFGYDHLSTGEPLLWVADVAAWCYGAGAEWRKRIAPIITQEIDLDYP